MPVWEEVIKANPIPWLLEPDNPSVRYFALTDLLGRPADDPEVREARMAILDSSVVRAIIQAQRPDGGWGDQESTYWPKYTGTIWQMMLLAELGVPVGADVVHRGLRRMSRAIEIIGSDDAAARDEILWCYSGNTIVYLARFGLLHTEPAQRALRQLVHHAWVDDGGCWRCRHNNGTMCVWGAVKVLKALAYVPPSERTEVMKQLIAAGAHYLLEYDYEEDRARAGTTENGWYTDWFRFGFPLFYESDLLEVLDVLTLHGYAADDRLWTWVPFVVLKADAHGRWILENSFPGRLIVEIEPLGLPSKWVTLRALRVLQRLYPKPPPVWEEEIPLKEER